MSGMRSLQSRTKSATELGLMYTVSGTAYKGPDHLIVAKKNTNKYDLVLLLLLNVADYPIHHS